MAHTLGGVTIHVDSEDDNDETNAFYAIQQVLDATAEVISWYGAGSDRRTLKFTLVEDSNGGTGKTTLKAAVRANANVNYTSDQGSQGNYRLLRCAFTRLQALGHTLPVYSCQADMIGA